MRLGRTLNRRAALLRELKLGIICGMARKANEEQKNPVGNDPDEWIAFADRLAKRNRYLFNGSRWAAALIKHAAIYVKEFRKNHNPRETLKKLIDQFNYTGGFISYTDPFSNARLFLLNSLKHEEPVPQEVCDVLYKAMGACYAELGEFYGIQKQALKLSIAFRNLVVACQKRHKSKIAVFRLVLSEREFHDKNSKFFSTVFKKEEPDFYELSVLDRVSRQMDLFFDTCKQSMSQIAISESSAPSEYQLFASLLPGITLKYPSFLNDAVTSFGNIVTAAVYQHRAWRQQSKKKARPPQSDPPKILPAPRRSDTGKGASRSFSSALDYLMSAKSDVVRQTPFYRGERKSRPKTPLSVQTSPKANAQFSRLNALLNIKFPAKPTLEFNEGVLALQMVSLGYFNALNDCARTPYLQMLTLTAKDNASRFLLFMGLTAGLTDPKERQAAMLKLNEYFLAFGASMDALAAGFGEFEKSLKAANVKKRKLTEEKAAHMIGISTRQLRNWLKGINRPIDFPGISDELKLIEWMALSDDYGKEWFAEQRQKMKRGGSGRRVGYDENLEEHQDPDKSGRN